MKKRDYILVFALALTLFLAACGGPATPAMDEMDALATMVAATVEAAQNTDAEPVPPVDSEPAPALEETAVPEAAVPAISAPIIYPDFPGLRVAYLKDGNVYAWTEGGNAAQLTNTGDANRVVISDDGQYIAYVREFEFYVTYELWVVNADGATPAPRLLVSQAEMTALKEASDITNAQGFDFDQVEWRPGTHALYYNTVPRFMGPGYAPNYDLRVINVDTDEKTTLFNFNQAGAFTFSPDGMQLALSTPESLNLVNADGSNLRANILTYPVVGTYSEYNYTPAPIWASDSMSLRATIPPADSFAEPTPPTGLWYLPVDGSAATQLGSVQTMPLNWLDNAISPDMSFVAYAKQVGDPTENQTELHLAYTDGSNDYIFVSDGIINFLGWTPDSTRFVYQLNGGSERGVYVGSIVDGSSYIFTSDSSTSHSLKWVDNNRVIFIFENPSTGTSELRISDQSSANNHAFIDTLTGGFPRFDFTK